MDIEEEFLAFLRQSNVDIGNVPPHQMEVMRRCFYGGLHRTITFLSDTENDAPETVVFALQDMLRQCSKFWGSIVINKNQN